MGFGMGDRSQMSACESSAPVLTWQDECGAHCTAFTLAVCDASRHTGFWGILTTADTDNPPKRG